MSKTYLVFENKDLKSIFFTAFCYKFIFYNYSFSSAEVSLFLMFFTLFLRVMG